jgi:hypothetical protein
MAPTRPIAVFYEHPHWFEPLFAELDVGGIEYLESERDGRLYFYDVNALSNFVAEPVRVVGFDPTARLVDALVARAGLEEADEPAAAAGGRRP